MSYLNQAIGRFADAAHLHHAAHSLELRAQSEASEQRKAIMTVAVHLIRESCRETIELGIYEYQRASDPNSPPDLSP